MRIVQLKKIYIYKNITSYFSEIITLHIIFTLKYIIIVYVGSTYSSYIMENIVFLIKFPIIVLLLGKRQAKEFFCTNG